MDGGRFSKKDSLAVKGAAILMMMWHHCFLPGRFNNFVINFWPLTQSQVEHVALFFKICVSLFAFVSGYGLYLTYQKAKGQGQYPGSWICEKLVRTLSGYWFVVLLSWIGCGLIDGRPWKIYGFENSIFLGVWNMLMDFFGFANLAGSPKLNDDWWYMSAAVAFIVLLPALEALFEKLGALCTVGIVLILPRVWGGFPGGIHFFTFLPIFCLGMAFAKYDLFARWEQKKTRGQRYIFLLVLAGIGYKLFYFLEYKFWWDVMLNFIPIIVILLIFETVRFVSPVGAVLRFLGEHSLNVYLIHAFIRNIYGETLVYGRGHFMLVIATLYLSTLGLSFVVEILKKAVQYEVLVGKMVQAVYKSKPQAIDKTTL